MPLDLVISEIMYDPASTEDDWEWIEIYNRGSRPVALAGFVLDDNNRSAHGAANVLGGAVQAGGAAILYNADDVSDGGFRAAWGNSLNLIPVTGWDRLSLNNSGDSLGLWRSFTAYTGDHENHAHAVARGIYTNGGDWPRADGAASIYLVDLDADPRVGDNWALSVVDDDSPAGAVYRSHAAGGNSGDDLGSPDPARPAPTPTDAPPPARVTPTPTSTATASGRPTPPRPAT